MQKILLALDNKKLEEYFFNALKGEFKFAKTTALNRGMVLQLLAKEPVDILVIKEQLPVSNDANGNPIKFDSLMATIRTRFPKCRIVIIAGNHKAGDKFLNRMVSRSIYDIVYGTEIETKEVCGLIRKPNTYEEAVKMQSLDEDVEEQKVAASKLYETVYEGDKTGRRGSRQQTDFTDVKTTPPAQAAPQVVPQFSVSEEEMKKKALEEIRLKQIEEERIRKAEEERQKRAEAEKTALRERNETARQELNPPYQMPEQESSYALPVQSYLTGIIFNPARMEDFAAFSGEDTGILVGNYSVSNTWSAGGVAKVVSFVSAREGTGCTSQAVSTATALASEGKSVLLLDAVYGHSCIFEKLGLPFDEGGSFNEMINRAKMGSPFASVCLYASRLPKGVDRFLSLPEKLAFAYMENSLSDSDVYYAEYIIKELQKNFDYIVADTSIRGEDAFVRKLLSLSSKVCLVITQDVYEINTADACFSAYADDLRAKTVVLVNKFVKGIMPDKNACSEQFKTKLCFAFPPDAKNYVKATSNGLAYYSVAKKSRSFYREFCRLL